MHLVWNPGFWFPVYNPTQYFIFQVSKFMTPKRPFSGLLYIKYRVSWKIECITRIYSKSMWKVLLSNNHQSSLVVKPHFLAIHQKKGIQISIETLDKENISIWILWFLESFDTVVCRLDGKGYFGLKTRVIIKISTHPC